MTDDKWLKDIQAKLNSAEDRGVQEKAVAEVISSAHLWLEDHGLEAVLAALETAIGAAEDLDQPAQASHALEQKAMLLHRSERSSEALVAIDRAIEQARSAGEPKLAQEFAVRRTLVLAGQGRLPEAIDEVGQVLATLDPEEAVETYLRLLSLLGNYQLRSAQFEQAETTFQQALSLVEGKPLSGDSLHNQLGLSQALVGQERYSEAQQILLKQLELVPSEETDSRWEFLRPAIEVSHQIQDWETLLSLTKEAMELASRQGDYTEANIHRENLISTLLRLDRLAAAKSHLEQALDFARRKGPAERKLVHLMNLGRVCFDLGQFKECEEYYQRALEEAETQDNERVASTVLGRQGALMAEKGELEAALELGKLAIARAEAADDPLIIAEQSMLLALTYRDLGQLDQAIEASRRAADLYQQQGEQDFAASANSLEQELRQG